MSINDYFAAYDAMPDRWPVAVKTLDVPSSYGTTRVNVCGPGDARRWSCCTAAAPARRTGSPMSHI